MKYRFTVLGSNDMWYEIWGETSGEVAERVQKELGVDCFVWMAMEPWYNLSYENVRDVYEHNGSSARRILSTINDEVNRLSDKRIQWNDVKDNMPPVGEDVVWRHKDASYRIGCLEELEQDDGALHVIWGDPQGGFHRLLEEFTHWSDEQYLLKNLHGRFWDE